RDHHLHHRSAPGGRRASDEPDSSGMGSGHDDGHRLSCVCLGLPIDESRHAFMKKSKIVIIGGGLAGVRPGYHLFEHEPLLLEKESVIGGLCRSFTQDGFTFDCTGHLIHLKNSYTKELIANILPGAFDAHERLAAIYSKSVTTPYPFQAN